MHLRGEWIGREEMELMETSRWQEGMDAEEEGGERERGVIMS